MALAFGTVGTIGTGTTSVTPGAPASVAVGDPLALLICNKYPNNAPTTPTGWTLPTNGQGSGGQGTDTVDGGHVYATWYFRVADGTAADTPAVTVTSGNSCTATLIRMTAAAGKSFSVAAANGSFNTAGTAWSVAMGTDPGITAGDFLLVGSAHNSDSGGVSAHAMAATGLTIGTVTERSDSGTTSGDDMRQFSATALVSSGTASGVLTYTATISATAGDAPAGASVLLRVREIDNSGTLAVTLAGSTLVATGTVAVTGTLAVTLADVTATEAGTVAVAGALAQTLADDTLIATGEAGGGGIVITAALLEPIWPGLQGWGSSW